MAAKKLSAGKKQTAPHEGIDVNRWLDEHGDALFRYARSHVRRRELAEDLVQETFLAAVKSSEPFRSESSVRTWLISILRRKIVDHYRKRSAAPDHEPETFQGSPEHDRNFTSKGTWAKMPGRWKTPPEVLENREFWSVFGDCVSKLPAPLASTFKLREMSGLQVEELRSTLALSAGNIRVRLHRARQLLRECLEKNWFGEDIRKRKRSP